MASIPTTTASGVGASANTQNPQAAVKDNGGGIAGSNVQPGTAQRSLEGTNGITLTPPVLPHVNLSTVAASSTPHNAAPAKAHFNPLLMALALLLFVVAIILFKVTSDSGKKHNQY